jgi:hypothetical protein
MSASSHGTTFSFDQMEAVLRQVVEPEIQRQFKRNATMYQQFQDPHKEHTWLNDVQAWTRLMRGELLVPHMVTGCAYCGDAFTEQILAARQLGMRGLGSKGPVALAGQMSRICGWLRSYAERSKEAA